MGLKHARAAAAHADAVVAAAVEPDPARCPGDLGCPIYPDVAALPDTVDAAIIAVPTAAHVAAAAPLLARGIPCLIEKPVAASPAELHRLRTIAGSTVLRVGHVERFNPAIVALADIAPDGIRALLGRRLSGASARVTDVDVVLDLMVHDIDAVLSVKRRPVTDIAARGDRDHAVAVLAFDDGATATLVASRVAPLRVRDLDVLTSAVAYRVDYLARSLHALRTENGQIVASPCPVPARDALAAQLDAFIAAVRGTADRPVTLAEAEAAMTVAWRVQAALGL
jgi:predicted dehydrogenase